MSFHKTQFPLTHSVNGTLFKYIHAGDVIRMFDGPFSEAVILGFDEVGDCRVARPYVYASSVGTTGPVPLLGVEQLTLTYLNLQAVIAKHGVTDIGRIVKP